MSLAAYKINRTAFDELIGDDEYVRRIEASAESDIAQKRQDALSQEQQSAEELELQAYVAEQLLQLDEETIEFLDSKEEQRALYFREKAELKKELDNQTAQNLQALQKKEYEKKQYAVKQRQMLADTLKKKYFATKAYEKRQAELKQLAERHKVLETKKNQSITDLEVKDKELHRLAPEAAQAADGIADHIRKTSRDHFTQSMGPGTGAVYMGSGGAAQYALDRDRRFQMHLETMSNSARQAKDPMVRDRIQAQIKYDRSRYGVEQNHKIESLTGMSRNSQINGYSDVERETANRIADLDKRLEERGIKVDFSQGSAPDIRAIQLHERMSDDVAKSVEHLRGLDQAKRGHAQADRDINVTNTDLLNVRGQLQDKRVEVAQSREIVDQADSEVKQSTMRARLQARLDSAVQSNQDKPDAKVAMMQYDAMQREQEIEEKARLRRIAEEQAILAAQQKQAQEQTKGQSL